MHSRHAVIPALLVVLVGCSAGSIAEAPGPFEGAWRLAGMVVVSGDGDRTTITPQESMFLFSGAHYSMAYAFGDEPLPAYGEPFQPTDEERLARFRSITVNTGTYEVSGSTVTFRPLFALVPEFVGGYAEHDYEMSDDELMLRWRRTFAANGVEEPFTASGGSAEFTLTRIN